MIETHDDVIREKHLQRVGQTVSSKKFRTPWRVIEKKEVWLLNGPPGGRVKWTMGEKWTGLAPHVAVSWLPNGDFVIPFLGSLNLYKRIK